MGKICAEEEKKKEGLLLFYFVALNRCLSSSRRAGTRIALCMLGSCERYSRKRVYTHHRDRGAHVCNRPSRANFGCWYCLPCVEQKRKKNQSNIIMMVDFVSTVPVFELLLGCSSKESGST